MRRGRACRGDTDETHHPPCQETKDAGALKPSASVAAPAMYPEGFGVEKTGHLP